MANNKDTLEVDNMAFVPEKKTDDTYVFVNGSPVVTKANGDPISAETPDTAVSADVEDDSFTTGRIMKNIILISSVFLCNFTAYSGLSRLQSSLHREEGMGTITQSILYGALVISCVFIPKTIINAIGHKWTIFVSMIGYMTWMVANGYAVWATMVPTSLIVGICAAPLWTAQCSYFTKLATPYAQKKQQNVEHVITRFFGIFFMLFQISNITGSVISSTILSQRPENATEPTEEQLQYCNLNDCPHHNVTNPNLKKPDEAVVWTMVGVYLGIAAFGLVILAVFADQLPKSLRDEKTKCRDGCQLLVSTVKQLRHKTQLLLIPITIYSGVEQTFYGAEWNKSFISCNMGIWMVGLATLPFGFVNAAVSYTGGMIVQYIGRVPIFITGMVVDLAIQMLMYFYKFNPEQPYTFYIISGMWGLTDGIWQTQINAMYGSIYPGESEAAFSNYRLWESLGFVVAYAYSSFLCTSVKLYIMTGTLLVGMLGYFITEWIVRKADNFELEHKSPLKGGVDNQYYTHSKEEITL